MDLIKNKSNIDTAEDKVSQIRTLLTVWADEPPTEPSQDLLWNGIREYRSYLLQKSDWTQLPDAPLTEEQKTLWATYRQELRDITDTFQAPDEVVFPEVPGAN